MEPVAFKKPAQLWDQKNNLTHGGPPSLKTWLPVGGQAQHTEPLMKFQEILKPWAEVHRENQYF